MFGIRTRSVQTPSGQRWQVGRRWSSRRMPRWRRVRMGKLKPGDAAEAVISVPGPGDLEDLGVAVLALLAVVVIAIVVIPLLLFGIELILLGLLVAAGISGRTLLGRPWLIQATPLGSEDEPLRWQVVGWRRSARAVEKVADALSAGLSPAPSEAKEPRR